uniref:Uncharacterized protein n=1 Tax=Myoviridae sp. ct3mI7 TaxID=2825028 RepID=A0A8S5QJ80_9CAUD|nr:MAG TPA: hypothetical protein [Myoviridae sp. ct3mI7]
MVPHTLFLALFCLMSYTVYTVIVLSEKRSVSYELQF